MRRSPHASLCLVFVVFLLLVSSSTAQEEIDPFVIDARGFCVIIFITIPFMLFMIAVSIFGHRMRSTAIRFHVINTSAWNLLHLANAAAFSENPPFPQWMNSPEWEEKKDQVDSLTRAQFPSGAFFLYIEQMIITCKPSLANNFIFNAIFAIIILFLQNLNSLLMWLSQWWSEEHWYNPPDAFGIFAHLYFFTMTFIYFIFCLFGSCCCCYSLTRREPKKTPSTFVNMWLLLAYCMIPLTMRCTKFGFTFMPFAMDKLMDYFKELGLMDWIEKLMSGGGEDEGGWFSEIFTMEFLTQLMIMVAYSQIWFMMLFPLVEAILTIICFEGYREQFFFFLSCGKLFSSPYEKGGKRKVISPPPSNVPAPIQTATSYHPPTIHAPVHDAKTTADLTNPAQAYSHNLHQAPAPLVVPQDTLHHSASAPDLEKIPPA